MNTLHHERYQMNTLHHERRSHLFTAYNAARSLANQGLIDGPRLNRALGIAQRTKAPKYFTTPDDCSCPDRRYRGGRCKHMIALALKAVC